MDLLDEGDTAAVSTRAITARAGVQAPAIYRHFGDKDGLLTTAAEHAYDAWVSQKHNRQALADPVEELRAGWDDTVQFGLDHPAVYRIANARTDASPALQFGYNLLLGKLRQVARAGRLRTSIENAAQLLHATGRGVILTLLDIPQEARDLRLSVLARESTITAIATEAERPNPTLQTAAVTLQELLPSCTALEPAERQLMDMWLNRITSENITRPS